MRGWLAGIIQRPEPEEEEGDDFDDSEESWEASLKQSDRLSDAHMEALEKYGIRVIAVPYRAHGQLMADLASGALDAALTTPGTFDPTVLRPVALVAEEPLALYPGLPTTVSLGHRPQARVFGGLIARSGTPAPVIEQMETAFRTAFDDATFQAMAARMGARPRFVGAQAFAARINEERLQMQALLKSLGLIG